MRYIDVYWQHDWPNQPYRLVSEIGDDQYETRKLEFFTTGQVGYAFADTSMHSTQLGEIAIPSLAEINCQQEFQGKTIDVQQFDKLWQTHVPEA